MNNILILEDIPDTRQWLEVVVKEAYPAANVISAATIKDAQNLSSTPIDLALVDLNLPDGSGVDFIHWMQQQQPNCYLIVATIYDDEDHLFNALRAGALGYLLKEERKEVLIAALKGVVSGQPPLSPTIAQKILRQFQAPMMQSTPVENVQEDQNPPLTAREEEVLNLVAKGFNRNEVADLLGISVNTAASHVKNIYRKLNVSSRAEVALEAKRLGLT